MDPFEFARRDDALKRARSSLGRSLLLLLLWTGSGPLRAADSILLWPEDFTLAGPSTRQLLVLEAGPPDRPAGEYSGEAVLESSDTNVVVVMGGHAYPRGNGTAAIVARAPQGEARARVTVRGMDQAVAWNFRRDVQPILAKYGCNSGACHGAASGKNGFRLSLRGYDDQADYLALTRHALGRRIRPDDPARSLLVLKPTGTVPHKGGAKFDVDSLEYRILAEWIAAGSPGPKPEDPTVERIDILPRHARLQPGALQPLLVQAHYSDGHTEDVTRWSKFTDANASVTQSDESGRVQIVGAGEGAVTAWFRSRIALALITVPYTNQLPPTTFAQAPRRNFIDDLNLKKLETLNLPPSPRCDDATFIRRAFLSAMGILPSPDEARAFLESDQPDKRDRLIDTILRRPEFIDYWTYQWSDVLLVQSRSLRPAAMWSYYHWVRHQVAANTPWDQVARQVVLAAGSNLENGAANFYLLHDDPKLLAENVSQAFLGMSINCAKCHNHPMEKWTNDEYYGFANLFARVRMKNGPGDGERILFTAAEGDLAQPRTGQPQPPRPLDGTAIPSEAPGDRRAVMADWLVAPDNPYFSRAIVNRVWANFFGVGLVEAVDDLRLTNPASDPDLLQAAARFLTDHAYDLQALMRAILQSETYQRTSAPSPGNESDTRFYSRYYPRRLSAEVLLDAFSQATGVPTEFPNYPKGWRALQLPDANVDSYFLKNFGRPEREKTCACERTEEPSIAQVLHIANGTTLNQKLSSPDNQLVRSSQDSTSDDQTIETLYLAALSRFPTQAELAGIKDAFSATNQPEDKRALLEDLCWAVLSSKEFLFNH